MSVTFAFIYSDLKELMYGVITLFWYRKELLRLAGANNNKGWNVIIYIPKDRFQAIFYHSIWSFVVCLPGKYLLVERKGIISVVAHKDATANDIFQSFVHALVMASVPDQESRHLESISWMDKHYESFIQKVIWSFLCFWSWISCQVFFSLPLLFGY